MRPLGAVPVGGERCHVLVWAPEVDMVRVRLEDRPGAPQTLGRGTDGYHSGVVEGCGPGSRYRFLLPDGRALADPASRYQPAGTDGPSEVVDLRAHRWQDGGFRPPPLSDQVLYEIHVGTFTPGGTLDSAVEALDAVADLGVTTVELMPLAEFPGRRNWGYDGVFPFAVQSTYGGPAALQRFVEGCHRRGLAVALDVVYNHVGPTGAVLGAFGPYFTDRHRTPWGRGLNFDGPGSDEVRRYFLENALGWFEGFHVDALRLDAVHGIVDRTATPFLAELARATGELGARLGRPLSLIAESADNDPRVVTPLPGGGLGFDAQWNDDFHHALHAVLTGEQMGYYADFGAVDQVATASAEGFVYQGQHSRYRRRRHGAPSAGIEPHRFVVFAQNHDQVGNRPRGDRLATLVDLPRLRLAAAVLLLAPGVPLLFMGEERAETAPFPYFVDHAEGALVDTVRRGRAAELRQLGFGDCTLDPAAAETFEQAVLDPAGPTGADAVAVRRLYQALLSVRRELLVPLGCPSPAEVTASAHDGAVVVVRRAGHRSGDRAVVTAYCLSPATGATAFPEAPGAGGATGRAAGWWRRALDSADPSLGGNGPRLPEQGSPGSPCPIPPWGFCAYRWVPAGAPDEGSGGILD